jgi:hypothetical protein
MPRLNLTGGFYNPLNYNLKDFDQFRQFLWSFYTYSPTFGFDFEDYYNSFTIDNFTDKFDLLDFFDKVTFYEEEIEIEAAIAQYWHEDDKTRWSYNPEWDISETFKMLSEDLLYMRDFIEDIRIFGTSIMLEGARRAADAVDPHIPVFEMPIPERRNAMTTHELYVFATFRQARAEEFFNQYYKGNRALENLMPGAGANRP